MQYAHTETATMVALEERPLVASTSMYRQSDVSSATCVQGPHQLERPPTWSQQSVSMRILLVLFHVKRYFRPRPLIHVKSYIRHQMKGLGGFCDPLCSLRSREPGELGPQNGHVGTHHDSGAPPDIDCDGVVAWRELPGRHPEGSTVRSQYPPQAWTAPVN